MATTHPRSGVAAAASWLLAALLWLASCAAFGWTEPTGAGFDHASTGYPLTGAHATQSCESCHLGGRMKGTPRTCESCHNNRVVAGKPRDHIPTTSPCDDCHRTTAWVPTTL